MDDTETQWRELDALVRSWWDTDRATAYPDDVARDGRGTLLPLPRPYSTAGGAEESAFPEMYGWDTHFINLGMLEHGRSDLVLDHLINHFSMIEQYGMVLNGNRSFYLTRSQPPLLADSLWRYFTMTGDQETLIRGVALLEKEYEGYWCAPHHSTAIPLATNRDLGDSGLRAELASEAETGLDFTAIFDGDVRRCVPLITNACLVRLAEVLAKSHAVLGDEIKAAIWSARMGARASAMREYCWNGEREFYVEYDVESHRQLEFISLSGYWVMWCGAATHEQAEQMVKQLDRFRGRHGLAFTQQVYRSPHPEYANLQWQHPVGWPPIQIMVVQALERYGFAELARTVSRDFVDLQVRTFNSTGALWEKYNVIDGNVDVPVERYPSLPMHGWSSAAVAVLGAIAFGSVASPYSEMNEASTKSEAPRERNGS